ncbi:MAG: DnaJ domain-containing protein [Thermosynechococcaceae cyanobacterium]
MATVVEVRIQELVEAHGYDAEILSSFAEFVLTQKGKKSSKKKKALTLLQLKTAVIAEFGCKDYKSLKKNKAFKLATDDRELNFRTKEAWLTLYREWVGVPENEQHQEGPTCINGIDILKNFRPWHVFQLDSKTATTEDINSAFRKLAKSHHPDQGGDREMFERLQKMRDSILAFR